MKEDFELARNTGVRNISFETHGEKDFVASTKLFVYIASANKNSCDNNSTSYGDICNCCNN